jgi:ribosomal protein S25
MVFWGIAALAGGLGKWVGASGEMKALGYTPPSSKLWTRVQKLVSSASTREEAKLSTNTLAERVEIPVSVTENTTRELEARGRVTPVERQ